MKTKSITTLPASPTQDRQRRLKRYVFTMSVRVLCFVVAVLLHDVWSIVPLILAGVIPWVAVVVANAGNRRGGDLVEPAGQLVRYDLADQSSSERERMEQEREQQYRDDQQRRSDAAHAEQEQAERDRVDRASARRAAKAGHH